MKPEEQRIAIASQMPDGFLEGQRWLFNGQWIIFDPLNDLNAMHEAWKQRIDGNAALEDRFSIELLRAVGKDDPEDGMRPNGSDAAWALASNATAAQRAEAFLKTLNLWKD